MDPASLHSVQLLDTNTLEELIILLFCSCRLAPVLESTGYRKGLLTSQDFRNKMADSVRRIIVIIDFLSVIWGVLVNSPTRLGSVVAECTQWTPLWRSGAHIRFLAVSEVGFLGQVWNWSFLTFLFLNFFPRHIHYTNTCCRESDDR